MSDMKVLYNSRIFYKIRVLFRVLLRPILMLAALVLVVFGMGTVSEKQNKETLKQVEDAVNKAVISCYSIEGKYPATVEYIEENYGLQVDHERYHVFYEIFADNIKPEVTVVEIGDAE